MDNPDELIYKLVESLYKEVGEIIGDEDINSENVLNITVTVMKLLEKNAELKGKGDIKKKVVLSVLEKLTKYRLGDHKESVTTMFFVKMFLPKIIDTIICLDKSEFAIKTKKCCKKYFCCL